MARPLSLWPVVPRRVEVLLHRVGCDNRRINRCSSLAGFRVSHSQTTMTRQPRVRSSRALRLSRSTLRFSLGSQNSVLDAGAVPRGQLCPCQKHPLTSTTDKYFGNTISGHPGKSGGWSRYR
jgi:hypothetical protein